MKILDKSLKLPPVEERHMPEGIIKKLFFPLFTKERDDTYIYYLICMLSYVVCLIFAVLYLSSYFLGLEFDAVLFEVAIGQDDPVRDFIYSFPFVVPTFLFLTVLPFGVFLFRRNVNLNKLDLLAWNEKGLQLRKENSKKYFKSLKIGFFLLLAVSYGSYGIAELILDSYNYGIDFSQSIRFLLFWCLVYTYVYAGCTTFLLVIFMTYYQNKKKLGPYYNKNITEQGV